MPDRNRGLGSVVKPSQEIFVPIQEHRSQTSEGSGTTECIDRDSARAQRCGRAEFFRARVSRQLR